ncbi:DUF4355 domain-containing protein [Levilactobacillus tangyuanensis]|uniref:DUF4355 domain-containing protein n=1 Tax=Levilactobacillus tangyuanensis TaxID=2486021 RepID=A0ABW1TP44_9LACO|nr:DUF4355 domain-containing protein [Levilactobacillus tangyuanensis]
MKRLKTTTLPMNLQYFADPNPDPDDNSTATERESAEEQPGHDDVEPDGRAGSEQPDDDDKNEAIIEKLKGRIGQEQGKKNALQEQLDKAQSELEKLRKGKPDKKPIEQTPEQQKVAELEAKLARRDTVDETLNVFNESGVSVPKDIVEVLVTDDHDQTIDNASKLLKFVTFIQKDTETSVRKEYQAGKIPGDTKHKTESLTDLGESIAKSNQSRASLDSFK